MIYYLVTGRHSYTVKRLLATLPELRANLSWLTYEELLFQRSGPLGHYIFSDIDRLSRYEREALRVFADALRKAEPAARILNDPALALDRVPLLAALHKAGMNDFIATRLDDGARPPRFPVFIRPEDDHSGPESDLIHDEIAFEAALRSLRDRGLPLHRRIAVGFSGKPFADGRFRRYSAYIIGGRVFGDELFVSGKWAVKDEVAEWSAEVAAEELAFVRANPHERELQKAFAIGHIDFGRADYGVVDGRVEVYEINTNPTFALGHRRPDRAERVALARRATIDALRAVDTPLSGKGRITFVNPTNPPHDLRWPRGWRSALPLARRVVAKLRRR